MRIVRVIRYHVAYPVETTVSTATRRTLKFTPAGAACNYIILRETSMAAPVRCNAWFGAAIACKDSRPPFDLRLSPVHFVEQVPDRLHHGIWTVRVDCDVSGVFEHAVLAARNRFG